ncbi:restriction endonuclease-related protein [Streptomyces jumonjinensis]|uniref:restriction endonuclease-related protein n=1 Tax=Streptomyces jumonjinensis TaxID=1945 RepID=UPI0037A2CF75
MHPWWGMDAVDAAVDFAGTGEMGQGEWWAADVKDHASATLLGRNFRWDPRATAQRRFLVLPEHRFGQHRYVDDLVSEMEGRVAGVEVVSENRFVDQVLARCREHRR